MVKGHLDGNIELIYSDGETVTIDKELLRSNSTVFAGMLEGAQGEKCTVAETETEVLQLVGLMLGEKFVANGDDWLCLVKIADKYDMPLVQSRLENVCWRLVAANEPDARLSTFAFADLLGARSLINAAAVNVIHGVEQVGPFTFGDIECSASGEQHLETVRLTRLEYLRKCLFTPKVSYTSNYNHLSEGCEAAGKHLYTSIREATVVEVLRSGQMLGCQGCRVSKALEIKWKDPCYPCYTCCRGLASWQEEVQQLWQSAPTSL